MGQHLTPYETYALFMSLKFHFSQQKYNYFTYHGKTKNTSLSFDRRNDKYFFVRLSRKYTEDEMPEFLVSNIIKGKVWIGEFLDDDAPDIYTEYIKRKQSLTYFMGTELDGVLKFAKPHTLFKARSGQYPEILQAYLSGEISLETLSILNVFFCFEEPFDRTIGKDDVIWSKIRLMMNKMLPFITYDKDRIKELLKSKILNT